MKANRITLLAQTVGMYVMHLPLYILFVVELLSPGEGTENLTSIVMILTCALTSAVGLICVANIVLSVISIFKGKSNPSKAVVNVKLALIPWYVLNFLMCVVMVGVMFNPFLMIGIPIVIALAMILAYFFLLGTSLPNVAYYFRKVFVTKEEKVTAARVVTVILHFIFCLDVVGGILFRRQNKKAAIPPTAENERPEND